jgi:hypothetical protein
VDGRDHGADPGGVRDLLDAADQFDRPRAVQILENEVYQSGSQRLPRVTRTIVVLSE